MHDALEQETDNVNDATRQEDANDGITIPVWLQDDP